MFDTKRITAPADLKADGDEGVLSAVFSTFDVPDSDSDIVRASTFTDGQPVPMVWSHDWSRPIGKGTVKVEPSRAVFKGQLFLDTTAGLDAYRTIKAMGDLQEYSWGFRILDAEPGMHEGLPVRIITSAEVFEVSPVLVGANRETYTLALKGLKRSLNRQQMDRIVAVILEALSADDLVAGDSLIEDEAGKAADLPVALALDVVGAKLLDDIDAYVTRLRQAPEDDIVAAKDGATGLARRLSAARLDLDVLLKRADVLTDAQPREMRRQFDRIIAQIGPRISGQRAG